MLAVFEHVEAKALRRLVALGTALFALCGYTNGWGTRAQ